MATVEPHTVNGEQEVNSNKPLKRQIFLSFIPANIHQSNPSSSVFACSAQAKDATRSQIFNLVERQQKSSSSSLVDANSHFLNQSVCACGINAGLQFHCQPFSLTMGDCELKRGAFMCDPAAQKATSITYRDREAISRQCRATFT